MEDSELTFKPPLEHTVDVLYKGTVIGQILTASTKPVSYFFRANSDCTLNNSISYPSAFRCMVFLTQVIDILGDVDILAREGE